MTQHLPCTLMDGKKSRHRFVVLGWCREDASGTLRIENVFTGELVGHSRWCFRLR
jgi:hypothetical protein